MCELLTASSRRVKDSMAEITDEFKAYVASWVEKVVLEEVHEACFPDDMDKGQRKVPLIFFFISLFFFSSPRVFLFFLLLFMSIGYAI